jgi:antitoxin MazE
MKTTVIQIGNSRGIRIPKPFLQQCGFGDEVELEVLDRRLVVSAAGPPRRGWGELFEAMATYGDDHLIDAAPAATP